MSSRYSPLPSEPPSYDDTEKKSETTTQPQQQPQPVQYVAAIPQAQPGAPVAVPQAPGYVYPQQPVTQPGAVPVQQMQYMMPPNVAMPQFVTQRPGYKAPHTYLVVTIVVMAICSILNLTSLAFGIPALIMAIMAQSSVSSGDYPTASTRAMTALVLNIVNIGYTLLWALIITASVVGTQCVAYYYVYSCGGYYD